MKGEYPWVITVDIICGGGNQILSETVETWIKSKTNVANAPKCIQNSIAIVQHANIILLPLFNFGIDHVSWSMRLVTVIIRKSL